MKNIKEEFSAHQYDFYTQKGFDFYMFRNSLHYKNMHCLLPHELNSIKDIKVGDAMSKNDFINYDRYYYVLQDPAAKKLTHDCYSDFFKNKRNNENNIKEIFNHCGNFSNQQLKTFYLNLFNHYDKKDVIKMVSQCSVASFKLNENPDEIQSTLNAHHFTLEENIDFWQRYLKPRQTDLNKPAHSITYTEFLCKNFPEDTLPLFFPYLTRLEGKFKELDFSFTEYENLETTSILFNLKNMVKGFNISTWDTKKYESWLEKFIPVVAKSLKADYCEVKYINKAKKHYRATLCHGGHITKNDIIVLVKDFFQHLYTNPTAQYDAEQLSAWIFQNHLEKSMPAKDHTHSRKMKI